MSVLACNRGDCENIMCDRYSYTHGYICNTCFIDLANKPESVDIEDFMESNPQSPPFVVQSTDWNKEFPLVFE